MVVVPQDAIMTGYYTPVISSIATKAPNTNLITTLITGGNEIIQLTGTNFGEEGLSLQGYYGPPDCLARGCSYTATQCTVKVANSVRVSALSCANTDTEEKQRSSSHFMSLLVESSQPECLSPESTSCTTVMSTVVVNIMCHVAHGSSTRLATDAGDCWCVACV